MARIRGLKPDFFTDEDLACLPIEARMFFAGLWCHADREGRLEYRPKKLKVLIMPYDDVDIEHLCGLLSAPNIPHRREKRFIDIYEVGGEHYIQVINLAKHQKFHKDEKSKGLPPCPGQEGAKRVPAGCQEGAKRPVSGFLSLVSGEQKEPPLAQEVEDRESSSPELGCLSGHSWQTFRKAWEPALQNGKFIGEEECIAEWDRNPAMHNQWLAAEKNYVVSKRVIEGFAMNPIKFLRSAWKDWQTPETSADNVLSSAPDFSWRERLKFDEAAQAEYLQDVARHPENYRPRDRLPHETQKQYDAKLAAGTLPMVRKAQCHPTP